MSPVLAALAVAAGLASGAAAVPEAALSVRPADPAALELRFDRRAPAALARDARKLARAGRYEKAEALLARRLELVEAAEGGAPIEARSDAASELASILVKLGRYDEAEDLYDSAWNAARPAFGLEDARVLRLSDEMGELYRLQGRWLRSEEVARRTLDARERLLGPDGPEVAESLSHLGRLLRDEGRFTDSESVLQRALSIRLKTSGRRSAEAGVALRDLASLFREQGRLDEAEAGYRAALKALRHSLGAGHPETAAAAAGLASVLRLTGEPTEAAKLQSAADSAWSRLRADAAP